MGSEPLECISSLPFRNLHQVNPTTPIVSTVEGNPVILEDDFLKFYPK